MIGERTVLTYVAMQ